MVILWHGDKAATRPYAQGLTPYRNADAPASSCPRPGRCAGRLPAGRRPDQRFHPAASQQAGDAAVDAFADLSSALDTWMQLSPVSATQIGDHRYDSNWTTSVPPSRRPWRHKALLGELDKIDVASWAARTRWTRRSCATSCSRKSGTPKCFSPASGTRSCTTASPAARSTA